MIKRCDWCGVDPLYVEYHDKEWGIPIHNDKKLFEFLILEGAQAGLNWLVILKKRAAYSKVFDGFNFEKIALYDHTKIKRLQVDTGIVRNKLKIESAVLNAKAFIKVRKEFQTFNNYIWHFIKEEPLQNCWQHIKEVPTETDLSTIISKDLRKRGFNFVGPKIIYAYMQAIGMVNDHLISCFRYNEIHNMTD